MQNLVSPEDDYSAEYKKRTEDEEIRQSERAFEEMFNTPQRQPQDINAVQTVDNAPNADPGSADGGFLGGVGSVARDILTGAREAVPQIYGGFSEAINEMLDVGVDIEQSLSQIGVPEVFFQLTKDGKFDPDILIGDEVSQLVQQGMVERTARLPETAEPKSVTGGFIRSASQFMTAFIPAARGVKALGVGGAVLQSMTAGAIADAVAFDPFEARLSTFLNEVPALGAIVPDYLADTNPENQSAWEGRMKNVLEGAGLGIATEGLGRAFKYYKAQRRLKLEAADLGITPADKAAKDAIEDSAKEFIQPVAEDEITAGLGRPDEDYVAIRQVQPTEAKVLSAVSEEEAAVLRVKQMEDEVKQAMGFEVLPETKDQVFINYSRIQSGDDVKAMIRNMAELKSSDIQKATGGRMSFEDMIDASSEHYTNLEDLLGRAPGPMSAPEAIAAREVLNTSASQLTDLARIASSPSATKADMYNFRRAMAVHSAIQSEVFAARTETARALRSWAIPAGTDEMRAGAIHQLMNSSGGSAPIGQLARAIVQVADNPTGLNLVIQKSMKSKLGDAFYQTWINGLLSSPKTQLVNALSNSVTALWAIPEKYLSAAISDVFYRGEIQYGEVAAQAYGFTKGVRDGVKLFALGKKAEGVEGLADVFEQFSKIEGYTDAISAEAFGVDPAKAWGKFFDYSGKFINAPGSLLNRTDSLFKSIGYRMEVNAQAYRQAVSEGLEGKELAERIADLTLDPTDDLINKGVDFAGYQTFTRPLGERGQALQRLVSKVPGGKFIMPFMRTPANILKYTFERTPLAFASRAVRSDIRKGGASAATAWAKVLSGSALMLTVGDFAADGLVSGAGPADHKQVKSLRRQGWRPYSLKIGDKWYAYNRLDPIGTLIGFSADITEIISQLDEEEGGRLVSAGAVAFAQNFASKTYLQGLYDAIGAMDPRNPTMTPDKWLLKFAGSLIPYSSLTRQVAQALDPMVRQTRTSAADPLVADMPNISEPVREYLAAITNEFRSRVPGYSKDLPPRKDLWGRDINRASRIGWAYDAMSPIYASADNPNQVDQAILDNKTSVSMPRQQIQGVKLTAKEYSRYVELAGQPAFEELKAIVGQPGFKNMSSGPDGLQSEVIKGVIGDYRLAAQDRMLAEFPDLRDRVINKQTERATALTGGK
jgi:hypothetical protein